MSNVTPTSSTSVAKTGTPTGTAAGKNTIAEGVVEKVAGIAAREVPGVHDLGNGAARAIGAIRSAINQQVAADIIVVAEYPVELQKLADSVRASVTEAISTVVGMEVTEVNVTVSDVFIPSDDDSDDDAESRVQ